MLLHNWFTIGKARSRAIASTSMFVFFLWQRFNFDLKKADLEETLNMTTTI